jgi:sulfonate transport system permease protein
MSNQAEVLARPIGRTDERKTSWISLKWKTRVNDFIIGAILPVIIVIVWQLAGKLGFISTFFLPTPAMILESFKEMIVSGEIVLNLSISIQRAAAGFAIGGGLGLLTGLLVGFSRKAEYILDPSFQMLRMVPHLALAPLIILWFGFGETSKIFIIANGAFFPMYINTFAGIRSVDNRLFDVAGVLEFSRYKQITRLILPAALPNILLGVRLSLAVSWLGLVVAELIGSQSGIGFLINIGKQNSTTEVIFVGVIIFAIVGKLFDSLVRLLEHRWLHWRDSYRG